jgi:hypothetical protein
MIDSIQKAAEEKLIQAEVPGLEVTMDPDEAESIGAFEEDALSERTALESAEDLLEASRG